jgi:hypothetical protein
MFNINFLNKDENSNDPAIGYIRDRDVNEIKHVLNNSALISDTGLLYTGTTGTTLHSIPGKAIGAAPFQFLNLGKVGSNFGQFEDLLSAARGFVQINWSMNIANNWKWNTNAGRAEPSDPQYAMIDLEIGGEGILCHYTAPGLIPATAFHEITRFGGGVDGVSGIDPYDVHIPFNQFKAPIFAAYKNTTIPDAGTEHPWWGGSGSTINGIMNPLLWLMTEEVKGTDNELARFDGHGTWTSMNFARSNGTQQTKTAASTNAQMGSIGSKAYDGTNYQRTAAIDFVTRNTISGGVAGQSIILRTSLTNTAGLTNRVEVAPNGNTGFGLAAPSAKVHIMSGSTTTAPLKLNPGSLLSVITGNTQTGAFEFTGTHLNVIVGSTRHQLDDALTKTSSDFYTGQTAYMVPPIQTLGNGSADLEIINVGNPGFVPQGTETRNLTPGGLFRIGGNTILFRNMRWDQANLKYLTPFKQADAYGSACFEPGGEACILHATPAGVDFSDVPHEIFLASANGVNGVPGLTTGYFSQSKAPIFAWYSSSAYNPVSTDNSWNPSTPTNPLIWIGANEVKGTAGTHDYNEFFKAESNSSAGYASINFANSNGTNQNKTIVTADKVIGALDAKAYDGSTFQRSAGIDFVTRGTMSSGNIGIGMRFKSGTSTATQNTKLDIQPTVTKAYFTNPWRWNYSSITGIPNYSAQAGFSPVLDNSTVMQAQVLSTVTGGALIQGFSTTASTSTATALWFRGILGSTAPTAPSTIFQALKHNGTTNFTDIAATEIGWRFRNNATSLIDILGNGHTGFGVTTPSARVHIASGSTTAASLKLNSGVQLTTITGGTQSGAIEYTGTHLNAIIGSTRYQLDQQTDIIVNSQTTNYTLALTDRNKLVDVNSPSGRTVTVPLNATIAFPVGSVLYVMRSGTGTLTIAGATTGVTITSSLGVLTDAGQNVLMTLVKTGTNAWLLQNGTPGAYQSYTPTFAGFSVDPVVVARYMLIGKKCHVWLATTSHGTSNSTGAASTTITLPFTSNITIGQTVMCARIVNSGANQSAPGLLSIAANSNVATVYRDGTLITAWTGSGNKSFSFSIEYEIA